MSFKIFLITTVASAKVLPNTVFLHKYKKYRAAYNLDGTERPVSRTVMQRFHEVMTELKVPVLTRRKIKPFTTHDINVFHAGSAMTSYGAIIGIPPNYEFEHTTDLNKNEVELTYQYDQWDDETREKFLEALILSENAQKFAIAREVIKVQRPDLWIKTFAASMDCFFILLFHGMMYKVFNFAKKPWIHRLGLRVMTLLMMASVYFITEEIVNNITDEEITEQLTKLGPRYVKGGKEYYEKLCELQCMRNPDNIGFFTGIWMKNKYSHIAQQRESLTIKLKELEKITM